MERLRVVEPFRTVFCLRRAGFDALQEILLLRGFIRRSHAYETLVDTAHAEAAVRQVGDGGPEP